MDDEEQILMDPSFEDLLLHYITTRLEENQCSSSSSSAEQTSKRARRSRTNSLNSSSVKNCASYAEQADMDASDSSDKSLTTNDNSFPTTGISSAPTSAELGTSPT